MGRKTFAVLIVGCLAWSAVAQEQGPPPRPLHKVGDHWTPYDPPTEFPPDAEVYIIQSGDTLWALAKKNLGNPYLWPQIWEKNKYIRDAHWIYPGDPLVIGVKTAEIGSPPAQSVTPTEGGQGTTAPPAPATTGGTAGAGATEVPPEQQTPTPGGAPTTDQYEGLLVPLGTEDDTNCFAYLDEKNQQPVFKIASAEEIKARYGLATTDIVFISGGDAEGVKAGQEFYITSPFRQLRHPITGAPLGTLIRYIGRLRVLCTQEHTATAEIVASCDAITIGSWLKPFEPIPVPMIVIPQPVTRCDPDSNKTRGTIVYAKDDVIEVATDHMIIIDLGEADQVEPGTVFTIYRDNPIPGTPRILLGQGAVMTSGEHWATAKITHSLQTINIGDRLEVR